MITDLPKNDTNFKNKFNYDYPQKITYILASSTNHENDTSDTEPFS